MTARILVVDDILPNVKVLEAKLSAEYFEVLTASSGPEALALAERDPPDAILLDVMMPGMDGFEVCRRLKADTRLAHIPVIMVTALSDPHDRVQGLDAGADDFLTKPVDDTALFARLRSLVRLKLMMDELRLRETTSNTLGMVEAATLAVGGDFPDARLLLVDDDRRGVERLIATLAPSYRVDTQSEPAEALMMARSNDYDLIIVSLGLLDHDGLRLCAQFRSNEATRQVPMLLLVDEGDNKRLAKGLEIGATDYVIRPIDRNEFVARVRTQIRRKRYQDRLRQNYFQSMSLAVTDSLTGLYNRRYMETYLGNLLARDGGQRAAAVMMLDIDWFKRINDTHGHTAGDEVLRELAQRLQRNVRGVDLASRYGGEEFVIVMPDTDASAAQVVAERIRRAVSDVPFPVSAPAGSLSVSCSIGFAVSKPGNKPVDLLRTADEALYRAKGAGKDCVVAAG
jgi:two-component system cell cycle response regulator